MFKMPKVPRRTPERKGKAREAGVEGGGEGALKGEKVRALRVFLLSFDNFFSSNDRILTYVLGDSWKVMEPDKSWRMETGRGGR